MIRNNLARSQSGLNYVKSDYVNQFCKEKDEPSLREMFGPNVADIGSLRAYWLLRGVLLGDVTVEDFVRRGMTPPYRRK